MKHCFKFFVLFLISLIYFSSVGSVSADIVLKSTFYVIRDFYEVNWDRDYWDTGLNSIDGGAGFVTYSELGDSMTVSYTGIYETGDKNNIMWGVDGQIGRGYRDFSQAQFYACEVKNQSQSKTKFQLIVSCNNADSGNFYPMDNAPYYLLGKNGEVSTDYVKSAFFTLPVGFEGYVLIPVSSYSSQLIRTNILRYSIGFPRGESGCISFYHMGWIDNDACLNGGGMRIKDESMYFELPERIILQPAPERPITEPETAQDNRTK